MTNDKRKMTNENEQFLKNSIVKDANIKEFIEEPKEIKSPNWLDKNKFKDILAIIDSNKLNYKNKICEFKHIDIKNLVNNRNHTISEIDAKKDLNTLNEIKNAEIIKCKKHTPGHKKLLNLFNDLLGITVTEKTLESESQKDKSKNENENENENVKNKINSTNIKKTTDKKKVEDKDILLEYIEDIDDKVFKEYSNGKNFNSFINEFHSATNKEGKEKIVKELKEIDDIVHHYAEMEDDYSEYKNKLFDIINAIDYFLYEYSKKWASDFNWREAVKDY